MAAPRIPTATYRLQFNRRFGFEDARRLVPYLDALGITDVYASPLLQARRGSDHGYDVTDPARLNHELGSEAEFAAFVRALRKRGMGLILDIVPNHMAATSENGWWMDVLASGPDSPFAGFFDINWHPAKPSLERKVLLPILGEPYGRALENQELFLRLEKRGFFVHYGGMKLPLSIPSYARVLSHRIEALENTFGPDHPAFRGLWELIGDIEHLARPAPPERADPVTRGREEERLKERLWRLCAARAEVRTHVDENVRIFNGRRGDAASFGLLDRLLGDQAYRLSYWRLANEEINYRRFFAINGLVGLRAEDPRVFELSHALILRLARSGRVTGLRVDHVDGLRDPRDYLAQLAARLGPASGAPGEPAMPFYVVVEKILARDESLPSDWPAFGTTGYDFLNTVNGVFVSARGARALEGTYSRFVGEETTFGDVVYAKKKLIMDTLFAGEMYALGQHLGRLAEQDRYARDLPRKELREALIEVTAGLPVYRTYARTPDLSSRDRLSIGRALKEAQRRNPDAGAPVFDFIRRVLLLESSPSLPGEPEREWLGFLMRWQQFTGPIMAKGVEDTATYAWCPLASLNEVGGDPASAGAVPRAFHQRMAAARDRWPHTLNATSTHDTKRSEDVRARLDVLSELHEEWETRLLLWSRWNEAKKRTVGGKPAPERPDEILLYQTLLGAWPLSRDELPGFRERIREYMLKAAREAKVRTRWIRPHVPYENALKDFVSAVLEETGKNRFLEDFLPFQKRIARYGALNSLGQTLLKIASPGVPDFYQGTETWNFSLVDPDNRRPVDFALRARMLNALVNREEQALASLLRDLVDNWEDGRIKLYLTHKALSFRRERADLFRDGAYLPVEASGGKKEHVLSFARRRGGDWILVAVPRLVTRIVRPGEFPLGQQAWGAKLHLVLPGNSPDAWRNVLTGELLHGAAGGGGRRLPVHALFNEFPVALLEGVAA
ncbi:MAG: malto-oligosyltrehalose synthase [Gemmatimonadota bacterium]